MACGRSLGKVFALAATGKDLGHHGDCYHQQSKVAVSSSWPISGPCVHTRLRKTF